MISAIIFGLCVVIFLRDTKFPLLSVFLLIAQVNHLHVNFKVYSKQSLEKDSLFCDDAIDRSSYSGNE